MSWIYMPYVSAVETVRLFFFMIISNSRHPLIMQSDLFVMHTYLCI